MRVGSGRALAGAHLRYRSSMSSIDRTEILILYASIGSGHKMAAAAIAEQIRELNSGDREVRLLDLLSIGRFPAKSHLSSVASTRGVASVYDAAWRAEWLGKRAERLGGLAQPLMFPSLDAFVTPATRTIISTHAMGAVLAARLPQVKRISVMTDLMPHAFWPHAVDHMCAATPEAADVFAARGFTAEQVVLAGIPVRSQFNRLPTCDDARAKLGLPLDRTVALVVAGAQDPGPYSHVAHAILGTLTALHDIGVVSAALTGTDAEMLERIRATFGDEVKAIPYTDDMAAPMAAADVVVAKAGGSLTAECLVCAKPLVLLGRGSGQERSNSEYLEAKGAALVAEGDEELKEKLGLLLGGAETLRKMSDRIGTLGRRDAARQVAELALASAGFAPGRAPILARDEPL